MHQEGGILGKIGRVAFLLPPSPLRDIGPTGLLRVNFKNSNTLQRGTGRS